MTRDDFSKIVGFMEGAWGAEFAPKQRDAYWLLLRDCEPGPVMARALDLARSSRSRYGIPKPGELLGADDDGPPLLAWASLVATIERHGHYDTVVFEDRTLSACVEALGGWMAVSEWPLGDGQEMRFLQRDFERLYRSLANSGRTGPEKHIGAYEAHNAGRFQSYVPEPSFIPAASAEALHRLPPRPLRLLTTDET